MSDMRFLTLGVDERFPFPGVDTRFPSIGVDTRFPDPLTDTRFEESQWLLIADSIISAPREPTKPVVSGDTILS